MSRQMLIGQDQASAVEAAAIVYEVIIDGGEQPVKVGDVVKMPAGCCHTVIAETELKLIEVQIGKDISVQDKEKKEINLNR